MHHAPKRSKRTRSLCVENIEPRFVLAGDITGLFGGSAALVVDTNTEQAEPAIGLTTVFDEKLHFLTHDRIGDYELWNSDGSQAGTARVSEIYANLPHNGLFWGCCNIKALDDQLYFVIDTINDEYDPNDDFWWLGDTELWKSDGTDAGTKPLAVLGEVYLEASVHTQLLEHEARLFMGVTQWQESDGAASLWLSDGTEAGTASYPPSFAMPFVSPMQELLRLGETYYFLGATYFHVPGSGPTFGLWSTNPDTKETHLVKEFLGNEIDGGGPFGLVASNGSLFFVADSGLGLELFKSDGTEDGTVMVKDIRPGNQGSLPNYITPTDDGVMFFADDGQNGRRLWQSDGTESGTKLSDDEGNLRGVSVRGIGANGWFTRLIRRFGDNALDDVSLFYDAPGLSFFYRQEPGQERILWVTDGTADRTKMLGPDFSVVGSLGDQVYVAQGDSIFRIDHEDLTIEPAFTLPTTTLDSDPFVITATSDGVFYLSKQDGRLRMTDGTPAGTTALPGTNYIYYNDSFAEGIRLTQSEVVAETLFIFGGDGLSTYNEESAEIELIKPGITANVEEPYRNALIGTTSSEDTLFFARIEPLDFSTTPTIELWSSDGTEEGTRTIVDSIPAASFNWQIKEAPLIEYSGGNIYFLAQDKELWRSDGTEAGTIDLNIDSVSSLTDFDGQLHFLRNESDFGTNQRTLELWKSDGTAEGTEAIRAFSRQARFGPSNLVSVGDRLFFGDGEGGLWKSDGSETGTVLVTQFPAPASPACCDTSVLSNLTAAADQLFFTVDDGVHGNELWVSDGTTEGTTLAAEIRAGSNPSFPSDLTVWKDQLFFAANDGQHGRELWSIDLPDDETLVGDVDGNGVVEFADFLILSANFGQTTDRGSEDGDLNQDGVVEFDDYILLAENFGRRLADATDEFR